MFWQRNFVHDLSRCRRKCFRWRRERSFPPFFV